MTILSSTNYYIDLAKSNKLTDLFFDFEISELRKLVKDIFDTYYQVDAEYNELIALEVDDREIKKLKIGKDNNESRLDHQIELIDELFCLYLYNVHIEQAIPKKTLETLHETILGELKDIEHAEAKENFSGLRKRLLNWRNRTAPMSYTSYNPGESSKQSKLERAISKARVFDEKPDEVSKGVHYLYKERCFHGIKFRSSDPIAVLKGSTRESEGFEIQQHKSWLDVLAYESAKTLGFGELFTLTTQTTIQSQEEIYEGSIQPLVEGDLLTELYNDGDKVPDLHLVEALVAGLVMGTFRASMNDILVDSDDMIQYLEVGQCLPHTNKVIMRADEKLFPTFRNDLTVDELMFEDISVDAIETIKSRIAIAKANLPALERGLLDSLSKRSFPKDWFELPLVIKALKERIAAIEEAIKTSKCPLDLIFAVNPFYKYYMSLLIAYEYTDQRSTLYLYPANQGNYPPAEFMSDLFYDLSNMSEFSFNKMIDECYKRSISPKELWSISEKKSWWGDWIFDILEHVDSVTHRCYKELKTDVSKLQKLLKEDRDSMLQFLVFSSKFDLKDS